MRSKSPILMESIKEYICDYYLNHEKTPSTTEIAMAMGIVRSTAYKYLVAMHGKGMIDYTNGEINVSSMGKIMTGREPASAVGEIPCGEPTIEEENLRYVTTLPTAIFGKGPFFILYATGDSMEDAGVEEGDILVIRKQETAEKGDIVVALDGDNQNTLKEYGGIDEKTQKAILKYRNQTVYGDKIIMVDHLVCQGVLSHIIKER